MKKLVWIILSIVSIVTLIVGIVLWMTLENHTPGIVITCAMGTSTVLSLVILVAICKNEDDLCFGC